MTDIVCISDTHTYHKRVTVPEGDILVHAGDFCGAGNALEVGHFLDWMEALPHDVKIVVPGNHDICVMTDPLVRKQFEYSGIHLLIDEAYTDPASGLNFYGVPWTPDFFPDTWSFQYGQAGCAPEEIWAKVPDYTDILISHGPPYGCADQIIPHVNQNLGSKPMRDRIDVLGETMMLRYVICGHIHGSYGRHWTDPADPNRVEVINASINTEGYQPTNEPIVLKVDDGS
jgi:Icc-related predicted phosphoesterase